MNHTTAAVSAVAFLSLMTACGPTLRELQQGAREGKVEANAPLHTHRAVTVNAPPERVWAVLTDVAGWPSWQPGVTQTEAPKVLQAGEGFTWVNGGSHISSTLQAVEPLHLLAWTGSVSVARAVHVFRFSSPDAGHTMVEVDESMSGPGLTLFYGQADLDAEVTRSLTALAHAAETR